MSDTATYNEEVEQPEIASPGIDFSRHPCFNREAHNKYGRIHLPVAPRCAN